MYWIFKKQQEVNSEEDKLRKLQESLNRKANILKDYLDFTTINLRLASEEEFEYLNAHPEYEKNGIYESMKYRYYRMRNLTESIQWDLALRKQLQEPKETRELILREKKNQ